VPWKRGRKRSTWHSRRRGLQMLKLAQTHEHMADVALQYSEYRCEAEDDPDWTWNQK